MALSVVNNSASLNAQQNLNRTSSALSKSLERLSTGLKVNRGADGPAALVISEQQRAQIAGLRTALDNNNKAVSLVQTGEGALNEINSLLTKARSLAIDSANSGVNDSTAQAANQAEITNILSAIDNIANTTKFGTKNLLNGAAAISGTADVTNAAKASVIQAGTGAAPGSYVVTIATAGSGGKVVGAAGAGSVTVAGTVKLTGGGLSAAGVTLGLDVGDNVNTAATKIQTALDGATGQGGGPGKFKVSVAAGVLTIQSNVLGSALVGAAFSGGTGTELATVTGLTAAAQTASAATGAGVSVVANVAFNGGSAITLTPTAGANGLNNQLSFGGASGLNFSLDVTAGATAAATSATTITVADNSLVFQIGANAGETTKLSIDKVSANGLGLGAVAGTASLANIDLTAAAGPQSAITVIDKAISDVSTIRGRLGAFQTNTLESNSRSLSATLENTVAAESVIRDTDFAQEIATFTRLQTQQQAGATVLGNANQTTALVAQLLRG